MIDKQIYSETYAALVALGEEYIKKIPEDVFEFIKKNSVSGLMPKIDQNKRFSEQGLSKDAVALIAYLRLNYLCKTEEEKRGFLEYLQTNEEELKETLMNTKSARDLLRIIKDK